MRDRTRTFLLILLSMLFLSMPSTTAASEDVVFWNTMQFSDGTRLLSEVKPDLTLAGPNWSFVPGQFDNGWDNHSESSYAHAPSSALFPDISQGAFAFWWIPDRDGDVVPGGWPDTIDQFISNGATNYPANNRYGLEFRYHRNRVPATFYVWLWKQDAVGTHTRVIMHYASNPVTGNWQAGDLVHVAFAWHHLPVIEGQYIAALWVDGELAHGWTRPDTGTLQDWATINPTNAYSGTTRIGDSIFSYSWDEQLHGPMDNLVFWNYAKSDWSDRFIESPLAIPPTADAGPNQAIHAGQTVYLDGSGSYDDVTATEDLLFDWQFAARPEGSTAVLNNAAGISTDFVADLPGGYDVSLVVTDEHGLMSEPSLVSISSLNSAPNADAGSDLASYIGYLVTLDGSGSSDPDNDPLGFSWTLTASPASSTAVLTDRYTATPTLVPDLPGGYTAELIVNDGFVDSAPDSVSLAIVTPEDYAQQQVAEAMNLVTGLPASSVTTTGNQQALSNFLSQAIKEVQKDKVDTAVSKLVQAIDRTDGCALRGSPDLVNDNSNNIRKDYVINCEEQTLIYLYLTAALQALQ